MLPRTNRTITIKLHHRSTGTSTDNPNNNNHKIITIPKNQPTRAITSHFQLNDSDRIKSKSNNSNKKKLHVITKNHSHLSVQPSIDTVLPSSNNSEIENTIMINKNNNESSMIQSEYTIDYKRLAKRTRKQYTASLTTRKPLEYNDIHNNDINYQSIGKGFGLT